MMHIPSSTKAVNFSSARTTKRFRRAICVSNPDCWTLAIHSCDTAPTPTAFLEIVGDYFPIVHKRALSLLLLTFEKSDVFVRATRVEHDASKLPTLRPLSIRLVK
jgi:hypothetical protein